MPANSRTFAGLCAKRRSNSYLIYDYYMRNSARNEIRSKMSAFPESGRSITPENVEIKVRFRPEADVPDNENPAYCRASNS